MTLPQLHIETALANPTVKAYLKIATAEEWRKAVKEIKETV